MNRADYRVIARIISRAIGMQYSVKTASEMIQFTVDQLSIYPNFDSDKFESLVWKLWADDVIN